MQGHLIAVSEDKGVVSVLDHQRVIILGTSNRMAERATGRTLMPEERFVIPGCPMVWVASSCRVR